MKYTYISVIVMAGLMAGTGFAQDRTDTRRGDARDRTVDVVPDRPDVKPAPRPTPIDPRPIPIPVPERHRYVVASPRVSLAGHPPLLQVATDGTANSADAARPDILPLDCRTIGAAHNFPRRDGRICVQVGDSIFFQLDNETEGVWYEKACGYLGAMIFVYQHDRDGDRWVPIGRDARYARLCGPGKGQGVNIGVPFHANRPGVHYISACVVSFALPVRPGVDVNDLRSLLHCGDVDISETRIRVLATRHIQPGHRDWANLKTAEAVDTKVELPAGDLGFEVIPGSVGPLDAAPAVE
jgi:hypothetical protein